MTRVSLTTSASPGRRKSGRSRDEAIVERAVRRDDEHARRVARAGGRERDALGRQVEVEEIDAHSQGSPFSRSRASGDPSVR